MPLQCTAVPLVEGRLATEMAYKSSPVLQTVIIPTDPIPVLSTIRQCRGREGETERHRVRNKRDIITGTDVDTNMEYAAPHQPPHEFTKPCCAAMIT